MTYPPDLSSVPPTPYPPAAPGPAPPQFLSAASSSSSSPASTATSTSEAESGASEEKRLLSGFGAGPLGSSASGLGGVSFGSCSVPASASPPASSSPSGYCFSCSSFGSGVSSTAQPGSTPSPSGFGGSLFGSSTAQPGSTPSPSGFGGSLFGSSTAQPGSTSSPSGFGCSLFGSSTTSSSPFGGLDPPPSTSIKSPFGLPAGHQAAVAPPAPSAAAAAATSGCFPPSSSSPFGCATHVDYPHPSTFQVPPTSQLFGEPFVPVAPTPVPELKKRNAEKKKPVSALAVDEEEGSARFPSRNDSEFRYRLTLTKGDRIKVWIEDKASKHQWESKELELSEMVPADRAIPMMELSDYFECFKSCLLASNTGLFKGPSKHDLVLLPVDKDTETKSSGDVQLQLTIGVHIFSKVLTPTYSFTLQPVKLSEMDILNGKIRDQDEEIESLRAQVGALASRMENTTTATGLFSTAANANPSLNCSAAPLYIRAETTQTTCSNQPTMIWTRKDGVNGLFGGICQVQTSGGIRFSREGLYNIQVVVHHTNSFDPENPSTSSGPFGLVWAQRETFVLQKNGQPIASSFGSTPKGTVQSSPLSHILPMKRDDELRVVYTGAGIAKAGSYILINQIK